MITVNILYTVKVVNLRNSRTE